MDSDLASTSALEPAATATAHDPEPAATPAATSIPSSSPPFVANPAPVLPLPPVPAPAPPTAAQPTASTSAPVPSPVSASPGSTATTPTLKQAHFDQGHRRVPSSAPLARIPSRPLINPTTSTPTPQEASPVAERTFTAPPWSRRASFPPPQPSNPPPHLPTPSLDKTILDLRTLLKSFLVFVPSSLRKLRFLLPSPLLRLSRAIIRRIAMTLHKRGALASSMFYDLLVMMWKTMINLFFREIRSRGAWKVPREGEGAIIFVVGPHHNQVSSA